MATGSLGRMNTTRASADVWRVARVFGLVAMLLALLLWPLEEPWSTKAARRLARGIALKPADYVQLWFWWGVLFNSLLLGGLALTAAWWVPWALPRPDAGHYYRPVASGFSRVAVWVLCGILVLAGVLRYPLLNDTLRRDEADTLVRNVHGVVFVGEDGAKVFRPAGWVEAIWEDAGANNPVLYSVLAHGCLGIWRRVTDSPREQFSAVIYRWPSYLAGLAGCAAVAVLGWRLGSVRVGLVASLLLAIHPWHLRYSAEGRGYALNMTLVVCACICLVDALRSGSWRWWAGWGLCNFLALYAYPGAIYVPAVAAVGAAFYVAACSPERFEVRRAQIVKLAVSSLLAGGLYVLLMLPCAPQILAYLERSTAIGPMDAPWWVEWLGCLSTGIQLGLYDGRPPTGFGRVYDLRGGLDQPEVVGVSAIVIPLFWGVGAFRLVRSGPLAALCVWSGILAPVTAWTHNRLTGNYLYPWYLIYFLPFTVWFVAAALEGVPDLSPVPKWRPVVFGIALFLYTTVFLHVTTEPRERLRRDPADPFVSFVRGRYEDRVYPEGWLTRHVRPEWRERNPTCRTPTP